MDYKENRLLLQSRLLWGQGRPRGDLRRQRFVGCLVGLAGEEGGDGDVFVEGFPVESAAVDAELFALLRCGAEAAGKPCEGDAEGSSVAEVDPHAVGVEAGSGWVNGDLSLHGRRPTVHDSGRASDCGGTAVPRADCTMPGADNGLWFCPGVAKAPLGRRNELAGGPAQLSSLTASG